MSTDLASRIEFRRRSCEHFNGILGKPVCAAGIDVVARAGGRKEPGLANRLPCLRRNETPAFTCDKRRFATVEEAKAAIARSDRAVAMVMGVRAGLGKPEPGTSGEVACPKCGGPIDWSASPRNGHVHGRCRTDNCILCGCTDIDSCIHADGTPCHWALLDLCSHCAEGADAREVAAYVFQRLDDITVRLGRIASVFTERGEKRRAAMIQGVHDQLLRAIADGKYREAFIAFAESQTAEGERV